MSERGRVYVSLGSMDNKADWKYRARLYDANGRPIWESQAVIDPDEAFAEMVKRAESMPNADLEPWNGTPAAPEVRESYWEERRAEQEARVQAAKEAVAKTITRKGLR